MPRLTNVYTKFAKLIKTDLTVVKVITVGTETSKVEELNGSNQFYVLGISVSAGNHAWVKDGVIQSQAPTFTPTVVWV